MPQSLSKVYVFITFTTKGRKHIIDASIEGRLHEYLGGICKNLECFQVQVGGFTNHIHVLCTLSKKISQMKLMEELKKQSSKWIKTLGSQYSNFYWQEGYGIFSVNPTEIDTVARYIQNQKEHHRKRTFEEEFRAFLKKYNVDYDERYVWD